jgi:hypothetical protein
MILRLENDAYFCSLSISFWPSFDGDEESDVHDGEFFRVGLKWECDANCCLLYRSEILSDASDAGDEEPLLS